MDYHPVALALALPPSHVRSAVLLAIFTVLPFVYVVPICLPRLELATWHTFIRPDGFALDQRVTFCCNNIAPSRTAV